MKKEYIVPQTEVVVIETQYMLAYSDAGLGAREYDDWDDEPEPDDRQRNGGRDDEDDWEE